MLHCCNGKHIKKAMLTVRKAGEKPLEYLKIEMEDLLVSHVSTGGSHGEDRLTENVTLNFAKVKTEYRSDRTARAARRPRSTGTFRVVQDRLIRASASGRRFDLTRSIGTRRCPGRSWPTHAAPDKTRLPPAARRGAS